MRRLVIGLLGAAAMSVAANAADMPVKAVRAPVVAPFSWAGFYIGVSGGGAFGTTGASETGLPAGVAGASGDYSLDHTLSGGLVGGTLGYNWQMTNWVWGVEFDASWANIDGTGRIDGASVAQRNGGAAAAGNFVFAHEKIDFFGTARLRAGLLVMPTLLAYATGGLAVGHVKYDGHFHYAAPVDYIGSDSATRVGWTIGGGLEYHVTPNYSVKGEYLYYDLSSHSLTTSQSGGFSSQFDYKTRGNIVRAGLNWKFM